MLLESVRDRTSVNRNTGAIHRIAFDLRWRFSVCIRDNNSALFSYQKFSLNDQRCLKWLRDDTTCRVYFKIIEKGFHHRHVRGLVDSREETR